MSANPAPHFVILLAGAVTATPRLRAQIAGARVIAADGGIAHAAPLGLVPELWVGDFDSATQADLDAFGDVPRQAHSSDKAATDGAIAVAEALTRGAQSLTLVGAFGGRMDHSFALMTQAIALTHQGIPTQITSGDEEGVPLVPSPQSFDYPTDTLFSVLAFSKLRGLTLVGARWPLDAITMEFGDTLTISNEVDGKLTASLNEGMALLVARLGDEA